MEKELTEILEQLRALTARVEALLELQAAETPVAVEIPEPEPVEPEPAEPAEPAEPEPVDAPQETPAPCALEEVSVESHEQVMEPMTSSQIRFSINDRFRFQRVIFGNSPERMANAMSAISAMTTADEVYTYLTNILNRDIDDPDVEDFFREVTLRFVDRKPLII